MLGYAITAVAALIVGILGSVLYQKNQAKKAAKKISDAEDEALRIINEAIEKRLDL